MHRFWMPSKLMPGRKLTVLRSAILEWFWSPLAAQHLARTIASIKPDLVWVLMYSWPIMVARNARLPKGPRLHVTLLDFPDTVGWKKIWGVPRSRRFRDAVFQLVRRADSWDGITNAMLEEITSQTGKKDGVLVRPGFEPEDLRALETRSESAPDGIIRLAYVGTIISERPFLELVAALEKLRPLLSRQLILEFYGERGYRNSPWFNSQWMIEHAMLSSDQELVQSLQRCSWGILVMDPEGSDLCYSQFSFPGKTGPYLSAGVPLLAIGHPRSSLAELMQNHRVGVFTTASQRRTLEPFLSESLQLPHPRLAFRENILRCAHTELSAVEIRRRLWSAWGAQTAHRVAI